MRKFFFKKLSMIFLFILLITPQIAQGKNRCLHPLSCKKISKKSTSLSGAWARFAGGLYILFADYGTAGINPTTEALTITYNEEQILLQAQNFGQALIEVGVDPTLAQKVTDHLELYAFAAENYGITLNNGGDFSCALEIWNTRTKELIDALSDIPNVKFKQINTLIREFQYIQLQAIQAFNDKNFSLAMLARVYGESLSGLIPSYLTKQLLLIHCCND